MPMARTKRGRLKQCEAWLRKHYAPRRKTLVRYRQLTPPGKHIEYGGTDEVNGKLIISIDSRLGWYDSIHALLHEWPHATTWDVKTAPHGPEWAAAYGRIYARWFDEGGCEASRQL